MKRRRRKHENARAILRSEKSEGAIVEALLRLRVASSDFLSFAVAPSLFHHCNFALLHLRLIGESAKVRTAQTGHNNEIHLNYMYILH